MVNNQKSKNAVLTMLINANGYISGEVIAEKLKISRVAVNKTVKKLRSEGYDITSVTNKGYFLNVKGHLSCEVISEKCKIANVSVIEETISTNNDAKILAEKGETAVIISKKQTGGKGRNGRKFHSLYGGVYFSVILRPNLSIADGVKITTFTAVAVANAIEKLSGLKVDVKWVNDLFVNGKKICGILTEAGCDFERGKLQYAVVGVGINVDDVDFPNDIKNIATNIERESGKKIDKNLLIIEILNCLKNVENEVLKGDYLQEYKRRLFILGKKVRVYSGLEEYDAIPLDVTESGGLKVDKNGEIITVSSGEVSVKLND